MHISHTFERGSGIQVYDNRKIWFGFHFPCWFSAIIFAISRGMLFVSIHLLYYYVWWWMGWVRIESNLHPSITITNDLISLQLFIGFIWRSILPFPFFFSFCRLVLYRCFLSKWKEVIIDCCYPNAEYKNAWIIRFWTKIELTLEYSIYLKEWHKGFFISVLLFIHINYL